MIIRLLAFVAIFLWVILASMPYRNAVMQHEQESYGPGQNRTGMLDHKVYDLLSRLKTTPDFPKHLLLTEELGVVYWQQGLKKFPDAEGLFKAVYESRRFKHTTDPYDKDYAAAALNLSALYRDEGRFFDASVVQKELLTYDQSALKPDDARIARDWGNIGLIQYFSALATDDKKLRADLFNESISALQKAEEIYRKALGPDCQQLGNMLSTEALSQRDSGRVQEATRAKAESDRIRSLIATPSTPP